MKFLFHFSLMGVLLFSTLHSCAQKDKSKRPSPPATVSQKIGKATITIHYSQPSVKGRTIGVDLEPIPDQVWRAGANEATVFETDSDVLVEGKVLPKGKYGFFVLVVGKAWNLILNTNWNQWGAMSYKESEDVFRVPVRAGKAETFAEKLTYAIDPAGIVTLFWGDKQVSFSVQDKP